MDIQSAANNFASGITSAEDQFNTIFKQPTQVMNYLPDTTALLGPVYDYSGELKAPSEIGIHAGDGSFDGINRAAAGVDYYASALGYGQSVGLSKDQDGMNQHPMGVNYFLKVANGGEGNGGCSNGAAMYAYMNTIPVGIPGQLGDKLAEQMGGIRLQGLAPGIINDAASALNPAPYFEAAVGSGFAACRQMTAPVGDASGALRSRNPNVSRPWIDPSKEKVTKGADGKWYATHWVFDRWISEDEYDKTPKTVTEGFRSAAGSTSAIGAGLLFAALFVGIAVFTTTRK